MKSDTIAKTMKDISVKSIGSQQFLSKKESISPLVVGNIPC